MHRRILSFFSKASSTGRKALLAAAALLSVSQPYTLAQSLPLTVQPELFGLNINSWKEIKPQDYTRSRYKSNLPPAYIHYKAWRLHASGVNWYNIERTPG
jgi:hypothetical protein